MGTLLSGSTSHSLSRPDVEVSRFAVSLGQAGKVRVVAVSPEKIGKLGWVSQNLKLTRSPGSLVIFKVPKSLCSMRITGDLKFDFWGIQETRIEKVTPMTNKWLVDSLIRNRPTLGAKWSQRTGTARWVRASNLLGEQPPLGGPCLGAATPLLSQVFRTSGPYCSFPLSPVRRLLINTHLTIYEI